MSNNRSVGLNRRQFIAAAGTVAATTSLAVADRAESVPVPPTPAHYLVTIDVTSGHAMYTAVNTDTQQTVQMPNNDLTVNSGDIVKWRSKTSGSNPKHHGKVRFTTTSPFAKQEFTWSENGSDGGATQQAGTYYYCVAIFDKVNNEIYADDPRVIVGGTFDLKADLIEAKDRLMEVEEKIKSVDVLIEKAIDKLK